MKFGVFLYFFFYWVWIGYFFKKVIFLGGLIGFGLFFYLVDEEVEEEQRKCEIWCFAAGRVVNV